MSVAAELAMLTGGDRPARSPEASSDHAEHPGLLELRSVSVDGRGRLRERRPRRSLDGRRIAVLADVLVQVLEDQRRRSVTGRFPVANMCSITVARLRTASGRSSVLHDQP